MSFPDKHAKRDKHLLRLEREMKRLRHAHWNAPIIPLERPYRRGWEKTFAIREDALKHPDAAVFNEVLNVVNQQVVSRNRLFVHRDDSPMVLETRIIRPWEWHRLAWPHRHQRLFALGHWSVEAVLFWRGLRRQDRVFGFKLVRAWWLEEIVQPHMITHQRVDLPEVRGRMAEIEAYMVRHFGWQRLSRLHGESKRWYTGPVSLAEQRASALLADQFNYDQ